MIGWILGLIGGAAAMYLLDPKDGSQRRTMVRDEATKMAQRANEEFQMMRDRAQNAMKQVETKIEEVMVSDEVIMSRVRSQMGHVVSNASMIDVMVKGGNVTLSGPVLDTEMSRLLAVTAMIPGVKHVENQLKPYSMETPTMENTGMETTDTI